MATNREEQYAQLNLQAMQAILLCELFARFRGRKAVVRPSKLFEHLYSRVSDSESLLSSTLGADSFSYVSATHPGSSSSSSSLPSSIPFSAAFSSDALPAWSPQTTNSSCMLSPKNGLSQYDHTRQPTFPALVSPAFPLSSHQISSSNASSMYDSRLHAFDNVSMDTDFLPVSLNSHGQPYSDSFSSQVLDQSPGLYDRALPPNAANFGQQIPIEMGLTKMDQWRNWVEAEGKRRVLAACFIIDNQAAIFHESSRARDNVDSSTIPLTGHSDALWSASSANEWFAILQNDPAASHVHLMPRLDSLTPEQVAQYNVFDRGVILNAAALNLPRRMSQRNSAGKDDDQEPDSAEDLRTPTTSSFAARALKGMKPDDRLCHLFSLGNAVTPNIYLALHHTPLHDLLAVSGDTWLFSQKVLRSLTFVEHQKRLKAWIEGRSSTSPTSPTSPTATRLDGMSAAKATIHAARALVEFFDRGVEASNGVTPYVTCISNYWGMYVCALIIWAFGQKSIKSSSSWSTSGSPISNTKNQFMSEDDAVAWLRAVADSDVPNTVGRVKGRREASAVIVSMVKRRLEADCVGGRSRLYVDAVGVLKKLGEDVNCRWF